GVIQMVHDGRDRRVPCPPDPVWTRLSSQLARMTWRHTGYSDPRGYGPLRDTLSDLLRRLRGIAADPEDIIITTGSVQTASIASQILFSAGDTVCVESPGLKLVSDVLAFRGCRLKKIPVDTDGILTSVVEADWNAAGVYVTSACQYPLGFELSSDRRAALLRWALKTGGWIIEDDYNSFLRVSESVSAPIRSIAGAESCTIFLASFSTTVFPGVRIGFAAVPHEVSDAFAGAKLLTDRHNPENLQAVLSEYIRCGAWDSHVRKLARRYRERYRFFMEAAGKRLSPFGEFSETKSGKHAVFFLNPAIRDTEAAVILEKSGIFVRTLSVISDPARPMNGFLFGYAYPPETVIPALDRVREVLTSLALRKKA
uniref:aminotransferase-like domain-containing protein n=1 Tax=Mesosutterella multiformis TaxID=2259133 RepID=UPI0040255696